MIKRGMTLIELLVAITLFVTIITMVTGSFVSISRTKLLISSMKESQQKIRIISEMLTRFGKEADKVRILYDYPPNPIEERIDFVFYGVTGGAPDHSKDTAVVFVLKDFTKVGAETTESYKTLEYYRCKQDAINAASYQVNLGLSSPNGCSKEDILSSTTTLGYIYGIAKVAPANYVFKKNNTIPPTFGVDFELRNMTTSNKYFDDTVKVSNLVLMENIK